MPGVVTVAVPHEPLAGQLIVVGDTLAPPVTDNVSVVGVWPLFVNATLPDAAVGALVVTVNGLGAGVAATIGRPGVPVPVRFEDNVPAPVATLKVPMRLVTAVGVNFTLTVQLAPAASVAVHVVDRKLKSLPVTEAAPGTVIVNAAATPLVSVADKVALPPLTTLPKPRLDVNTGPLPLVAPALIAEPSLVARMVPGAMPSVVRVCTRPTIQLHV